MINKRRQQSPIRSIHYMLKLSLNSKKKWTLQKLSLLSHALHPQHTLLLTADGADEDDPTAGVATQELDAENNSPNVDALARLKSDFNLKEFLALATRVIDEGDTEAITAISDLKNRWIAKFGGDFADAPPLRPVAHRPPTPFRHAIVLFDQRSVYRACLPPIEWLLFCRGGTNPRLHLFSRCHHISRTVFRRVLPL
ncbi:UNVERIFIED_CONTAM: hypothetical protein Slati_2463900 [Sesamum latifolium]|uniref:Uncharacterized protein n=1 Tax=Sesamum latifolium TaxID=2727402 RepID=A0AAW2WDH6_9LAMI